MKRNLLAASVAALAAGNAAAADFDFVIGGASAPTRALGFVVSEQICDANVQTVTGGNGWVIECTVGANTVAFYKEDSGSSAGVAGLDDKTAKSQLADIATLSGAGCAVSTDFATALASPCATAPTVNRVPDAGVSDVDPRIFVGPLSDLADQSLMPVGGAEVASNLKPFNNNRDLQVSNLGSLLFGIVATSPFYAALQHSQFQGDANCDPVAAGITDLAAFEAWNNSDSLECMPSLARAEVAAMLSGALNNATQLGSTAYQGAFADYSNVADNAYGEWFASSDFGTINLCLRNSGSGTHAVTTQYFLRSNCGAVDTRTIVARECDNDTSGDDCGVVVGNEGSSDMSACLNVKSQNGKWAIGYQSLENNANQSDAKGSRYRFVKIDGVAPTVESLVKGEYKEFGNVTMQYRGTETWSAENGIDSAAEEAAAAAIFADIVNAFATAPAALGDLNTNAKFQHAFGEAGWAAQAAGAGQMIGFDVNKDVAGHFAKPVQPLVYPKLNGIQGLCGTPSTVYGSVDAVK